MFFVLAMALAAFAAPALAQTAMIGSGGVDILGQGIFETGAGAFKFPAAVNANYDSIDVGNDMSPGNRRRSRPRNRTSGSQCRSCICNQPSEDQEEPGYRRRSDMLPPAVPSITSSRSKSAIEMLWLLVLVLAGLSLELPSMPAVSLQPTTLRL